MVRPIFRRVGISAALVAATASLGAYSLHQYGWGGIKQRLKPTPMLALNSRAADDDVDPAFITGDNPVSGRYVIALVEANDSSPAPYAGPYVDPDAPGTGGGGTGGGGTGPGTVGGGASANQGQVVQPTQPANEYWDTPVVAADLCDGYGGTVSGAYSHVGCFVAENITEGQARAMSHDSRVLSVSEDWAMQPTGTQAVSGYDQWGLDQLDSVTNSRSNTYTYSSIASNVHAYIMDSGINVNHPDFGGRASLDYSAVDGENPSDTNVGHGTPVASIVGGSEYGVAKGCRLHSVKVIENSGTVYVSAVVKACDWVKGNRQLPAVVNMSFGGRTYRNFFGSGTSAQDTAARRLADSGVTVVCSAGNDNIDASQFSPANVQELIVVGAADRYLNRAKFWRFPNDYANESNYGGRVDLSGPGLDVKAAGRLGSYVSFGGTSSAAPFVAGVAARYLSTHPYANHYAVQDWLINNAAHKMQTGDLKGSPDRFIYAPPSL